MAVPTTLMEAFILLHTLNLQLPIIIFIGIGIDGQIAISHSNLIHVFPMVWIFRAVPAAKSRESTYVHDEYNGHSKLQDL